MPEPVLYPQPLDDPDTRALVDGVESGLELILPVAEHQQRIDQLAQRIERERKAA